MGRRTDIKHGVCKPCGRRRILWLPAKLCDRCLLTAALDAGIAQVEDQGADSVSPEEG